MRKMSILLVALTAISVSADEAKPKYAPTTVRLTQKSEYVRKNAAPDFWAMAPYYVAQRDGRSCSLATFAAVFNGLRVHQALTADDQLITQDTFYKKLTHPALKRFFEDKGKSISLDEFAEIANEALKVYGISGLKAEAVHIDDTSDQTMKKVVTILNQNEKSDHDFVFANFIQGKLTGDPEGLVGHVSPIAAFNPKDKTVLVMDVDREWYEPYWVSVKTFLEGMNTFDKDAGKNRGLVWIH